MPVLAVFNNQFMLAESATSITAGSDPIPMSGFNYLDVATHVESLFNVGAAAGRLTLAVDVSDDGQHWSSLGLGGVAVFTAVTTDRAFAEVASAFIRVRYTYDSTAGAAGDITAVMFDCHVNLMQK